MFYQLFGVGALAHRGLPTVRVFVREVPLAFSAPHHSARESCPGHCGTLFYGTDFQLIGVTFFMPKQIWFSVPRRLLWFREQSAHPCLSWVFLLPFPADWFHSHLPHAWVKMCVQPLTGDTFEYTTNKQFPSWTDADCAVDCSGQHLTDTEHQVQFGDCRGRSSSPSGIMQIVTSAVRFFFHDAPLDTFSLSFQ